MGILGGLKNTSSECVMSCGSGWARRSFWVDDYDWRKLANFVSVRFHESKNHKLHRRLKIDFQALFHPEPDFPGLLGKSLG